MTKKMQIFEHEIFGEIRVIDMEGNPWWVATDVCKTLGLENVTKALLSLDHDEKSTLPKGKLSLKSKMLRIVSEAGLYRLIFKSRKPETKEFKKWVVREVLPTIRKTGRYDFTEMSEREKTITLAKAVLESDKKIKDLELKREEDKPKVEFYDEVVSTKGLVGLQEAGKLLGLKPNLFIEALRDMPLIFKRKTTNLPYQKFIDQGLFVVKLQKDHTGKPRSRSYITPKGLGALRAIKPGLEKLIEKKKPGKSKSA